jgi:hypothetical protein
MHNDHKVLDEADLTTDTTAGEFDPNDYNLARWGTGSPPGETPCIKTFTLTLGDLRFRRVAGRQCEDAGKLWLESRNLDPRAEPELLYPVLGGATPSHRLLKNSNVDALEGAHLQVRYCSPFIFVIPSGFSPEESAVSSQRDDFFSSLSQACIPRLQKRRGFSR